MTMDYAFPSFTPGSLTLIVGLGQTGVAAALWCAARAERLRVLDTRAQPAGLADLEKGLQALGNTADLRLGAEHFNEPSLQGVQRLVLSPGLSPLQEPQRTLLAQAARMGIPIQGEMELFALALADLREQGYDPRIVAVTGTNGKTTVVSMTRNILAASGSNGGLNGSLNVRAAGNIGPAALTALMDALAANHLPQVWVLELSSFQLQTTRSLRLDAAAVLNLTQDHLDWHGDMTAYGAAKKRLLDMAQVCIVNRDDKPCLAMVREPLAVNVRTFGAGLTDYVGDMGLDNGNGLLWLAAVQDDDDPLPEPPVSRRRKKGVPDIPDEPVLRHTGKVTRLMPVEALGVRGRHHALNALAALALGRVVGQALGLGWGDMLRTLRSYAGEPHRSQFVRTVEGVHFVNDSKATNVGATLAALSGMEADAGSARVVLIAGGVGKGQDFSPLAASVAQHARAVVLMGQDRDALHAALQPSNLPIQFADSLGEAVQQAHALAQAGDTVLLSPACASLDMFRDYAHRGQVFEAAVQALAREVTPSPQEAL